MPAPIARNSAVLGQRADEYSASHCQKTAADASQNIRTKTSLVGPRATRADVARWLWVDTELPLPQELNECLKLLSINVREGPMRAPAILLSLLVVVAACTGDNGRDGLSTLVVVTPEPTGADCATGGQRIDVGLDDGAGGGVANNGVLEAGEIETTDFVCNGADGLDGLTSLVAINEACSETQCPQGGVSIDSGLDTNDDQTLDPSEVTQSALVCGGTLPPPALVGGDFTQTTDWTVTGAAAIDTSAPGNDDAGEAIIDATAACAGDTVSQTLSLPSACASQPLAVRMAVRAVGSFVIGPSASLDFAGVSQNGRRALFNDTYVDDVMCLGAAAYGGSRSIGLSHPARPGPGCSAQAGVAYDNVVLVAAPSICPQPGTVLNGSFDDEVAGWRPTLESGGTFSPAVDDGVHVGRLSIPAGGCPQVLVEGEASVPLAAEVAEPALEFRWRSMGLADLGTSGAAFEAQVYNGPVGFGELLADRPLTFTDSVGYTTERLCLGSTASGIVVNVWLRLAGAGLCAGTPAADVFVDGFRLVDEPSCP